MNKKSFRNIFLFMIFLVILGVIFVFAYALFSKNILNSNISDSLDSTIVSNRYVISSTFENDYNRLKDGIIADASTKPTIEQKVDTIKAYLNNGYFPSNIEAGCGYINIVNYKKCYHIGNTDYLFSNAYDGFSDPDDVLVVSFYDLSVALGSQSNVFKNSNVDKNYVVFRFKQSDGQLIVKQDDLIIYVELEAYLSNAFSNNSLKELTDTYIVFNDGTTLYDHNNPTSNAVFYEEFDDDITIEKVKTELTKDKDLYTSIYDCKYKGANCFVLAANLSSGNVNTNMILVCIIDYDVATSSINDSLSLIIGIFMAILITVSIALIITYYVVNSRNTDLEAISFANFTKVSYRVDVNRFGQIKKMSRNLHKLLIKPNSYTDIVQFNFINEVENIKTAITEFMQVTAHILPEQTKTGQELYIRFVVLRKFGIYMLVGVDATQEELTLNRNHQLAFYNRTTNLPNSEIYKLDISKFIKLIENKKLDCKIALIAANVKNFKSFETFYGEQIFDKITLATASTLQEVADQNMGVRIYSFTEDTFGFIVSGLNDYKEAEDYVKKMIDRFNRPIHVDENSLMLDVVYAIYNLDLETYSTDSAAEIFVSLEKLLTKVVAGVNTYEIYNLAIERYLTTEAILEKDLKIAIDKGEFEMYLQPQFFLEEDEIGGFEMLIRWNNPKYFYQSPQHFIEVAEKNGLIIQLGKFINEQAMKISKILEPYNIELSVNVSPVQFLQSGFVNEFVQLADKYQVNKKLIALEITETFLMENFDVMVEKLKVLRKQGFSIHLDDFGTGYSSMLYLKELPIDCIKIDKEFTKYVNIDRFSKEIVKKLTALGRSLELDIIAEGVEDLKQVDFLRKNGCNIIQGYIISKAVPVDSAMKLVDEYNVAKTKTLYPEDEKEKPKKKANSFFKGQF